MSAEQLRVLFAASEFAPLIKTGGLADVAGALSAALIELGVDVRVLLPGYREVLSALANAHRVARFPGIGSFPQAELLAAEGPKKQSLLVLVCPQLFERDAGPYTDAEGKDLADNALRFGLLSYAAAVLAGPSSPYEWRCQILHCNDWQTGLAPAYQYWRRSPRIPCMMTIHNLAYQGIFPPSTLRQLALPAESLGIDGIEYYGNLSFLKAGLFYAQRITTVSPTYAREIQATQLGFGLHGLLRGRHAELEGILNGIDVDLWNPHSDPALEANYDADTLENKAINTRVLRTRFGLEQRTDAPLIGIVSRLVSQKGIDLIVACAERIAQLPAQLLVLGTGDAGIERDLRALAERLGASIAVEIGFDENLSHRIEAGADMFLMPSRFEPCGLNQMYSQRYGTPPIARRTGGLADSIVDYSAQTLARGTASGFLFDEPSPDALLGAISRALDVWRTPKLWAQVQRNGMRRDFSWCASARRYLDLYRTMLPAS